jgi:hypothetical protein
MGEANRKRQIAVQIMSIAEAAAVFEARGMTSPDRHDLIIAVLGRRVRVAEVGVDNETGRVKVMAGETSLEAAMRMFGSLPAKHNLGMVSMSPGQDHDCGQFLTFVRQQAQRKNFSLVTMHGARSAKDVFNGFFKTLGDVPHQGQC